MSDQEKKYFHLSLRVQDLRRSVEFYGRFFGVSPVKYFSDYAKFELENPALVLALEPIKENSKPGLDHLGVRLNDRSALVDASTKISERELAFEHLQGVTCCYSRQSKIFLDDPDGHMVEMYTVEADIAEDAAQTARTSTMQQSQEAEASALNSGTFDHLLPAPFPKTLAFGDNSVKEIQLRGTFNAAMTGEEAFRIIQECQRVLSFGGSISTHMLVADIPVAKEIPTLPEPASHVRRVPTEAEMIALFEEVGFTGITLKRFSHSSVFNVGGAEFREFLMTATKASHHEKNTTDLSASPRQTVVYRGPFPSVTDELGTKYERGRRVSVSANTAKLLRLPPYVEAFVFVNTVAATDCG